MCLPPRASGLTPRPSPSRGEGRPRGQVIVSMILRVIQRDQRSWMRAAVVGNELSPPLINFSTTERKHNSTSCALWSLPRIFLFCAPVGGGGAHRSVCFLHADACPTHPDLPASVCQHACISVVPFPRMLGGTDGGFKKKTKIVPTDHLVTPAPRHPIAETWHSFLRGITNLYLKLLTVFNAAFRSIRRARPLPLHLGFCPGVD